MTSELTRRFALLELCAAAEMAEEALRTGDHWALARRLRWAVRGARCHWPEAAATPEEVASAVLCS